MSDGTQITDQDQSTGHTQTTPLRFKQSVSSGGLDVLIPPQFPVQQDSPPPSLVFPCGHRHRPTAQFCPECGKPVTFEEPLWTLRPPTTSELSELATLYYAQERYEDVEPLYRQMLEMREQRLGPHHPSIAQSLNNLAVLYEDQGKNLEAEPFYRRALTICEQQLGPEHPATVMVCDNYRFLLQKIVLEDNIAVELLHPSTADHLSELGAFSHEQGKYHEAERLYQLALAIQEMQLGYQYPNVVNNLAVLYEDQGRNSEADPLYRRALAISEQQLGLEHPATVMVRDNYSFLLNKHK